MKFSLFTLIASLAILGLSGCASQGPNGGQSPFMSGGTHSPGPQIKNPVIKKQMKHTFLAPNELD